jgi:hypothetical protein
LPYIYLGISQITPGTPSLSPLPSFRVTSRSSLPLLSVPPVRGYDRSHFPGQITRTSSLPRLAALSGKFGRAPGPRSTCPTRRKSNFAERSPFFQHRIPHSFAQLQKGRLRSHLHRRLLAHPVPKRVVSNVQPALAQHQLLVAI